MPGPNRRFHQSKILHRTVAMLWVALAACAHVPPSSQNRETASIREFVDDVMSARNRLGGSALLVAFDLDNTLLAMEQGLGSDQWYEWQKERYSEDRCDPRVVSDRLAVQGALYYASAMRPTQPDAAAQVRRIQDAGIPAIALTSRGVEYRLQTFRELRRNGFDFRRSAIGPGEGWPENFTPVNGIRPARYEDGVFLTSGQHKGAMLEALLQRTGHPKPRILLMLDDKQDNLDAARESMEAAGVAVHAWRYAGEDANVAAFDPDASDRLWQSIHPALVALQRELGPDHYRLPDSLRPEGCD